MPRKSAFKCYFGCIPYKGTVHHFPPNEYPHMEKFDQWKMVISEIDRERGDNYIYNNIRICDYHFEEYYRTAGGRLTKNAVPTLNIGPDFTLHKFPDPEKELDRFNRWIFVIGGNVLMMDPKSVFKNGRVCHEHFEPKYYTVSKRLSKDAVPSLFSSDSKNEKNTLSNHAALSDATLPSPGSSEDHNIREPSPPPQLHLHTAQMCTVCLALDVKMFDLRDTELKIMFQSITGITFEENKGSKLGSLICWECTARLKAAATFRSKALFSESLLQSLINSGEQIQKIKFETVKEQADDLAPKTLTVTEVFHIVDIEDQNNMTEESIMEEMKDVNSEMDIAGDDNVAIITDIEDDSICPNTEEENMTIILEGNPLHSTSSIEETINSGYSRPLQDIGQTSHQSDLTTSREDFDDQIIKTFLESITKSKIVPKQYIRVPNPIERSKRAEIHDQSYYLKRDSEGGNKKKKLKTYGESNKKPSVKERQEIHTSSGAVANTVAEEEI